VNVAYTWADEGLTPRVSVVIVTAGRPRHLAASLASYTDLAPVTPPFEVIVVLDGENADSRAIASTPYSFPTRVRSQPAAGISAAKNLGVSAAKGDLVLFLNDDTRPDPACLRAHVEAQRRFGPCIAVGRVEWDPDHEVTPYMAWLAPAGHQFNFARLRPEAPIPWDACWGAHLAAPRAWLLDEPFDPSLPHSVLEDGEWAYRQSLRGRTLRYLPEACAFHDHRIAGPREYARRPRSAGAAARSVVARHPRLAFKLLVRPVIAAAAATALAAWPGRWRRTTSWDLAYRWRYVAGIFVPPKGQRATPGHGPHRAKSQDPG
jgi:GT2 family glycosyltransferase